MIIYLTFVCTNWFCKLLFFYKDLRNIVFLSVYRDIDTGWSILINPEDFITYQPVFIFPIIIILFYYYY